MYADTKGERFITFKRMINTPDLKDTFGLPEKVNVKNLNLSGQRQLRIWVEISQQRKRQLIRLFLLRTLMRLKQKGC